MMEAYQRIKDKGQCHACLQPVADAKDMNEEIGSLHTRIESKTERAKHFKDQHGELRVVVCSIDKNIISMQNDMQDLRMVESTARSVQVKEIEEYGRFELRLSGLLSKQNEANGKLKECEKHVDVIKADVSRCEHKLATAISYHEMTSRAKNLMTPAGAVRSLVIQNAIDFINLRLSEYSRELLGDRSVMVTSEATTKSGDAINKIGVSITGGRSYESFSSGERRRVDLSIQLALNDMASSVFGAKSNLLVCDEIDNGLDVDGLDALARVLSDLGRTRSVFLVSHHPYLRSAVHRKILVRKSDGISTLSA
jgi:DNA repair exonuclease SbcCD ATPase subunit